MCGIAGMVGISYDLKTVTRMENTMLRRGPDGRGVYIGNDCLLLHRRLAIVAPEGGAQPMSLYFQGKHYTMVYNGELYNTQELKRELESLGHIFLERSDTEVLLHAYVQWKEQCLQKLNGIYGFAVWEQETGKLFLARDRMGVKPLFYACQGNGIVFASEIKTILASGAVAPRLDRDGAAQLLLLGPGRIPGSGVFKDILELKPGYYGIFHQGRLQTFRYWRLTDGEHKESFEETAEYVKWLVTDAICRQMVSDVPLGTFLSGGLDSSIITAVCAREQGQPLQTFSVDYENNEKYFVSGKFQPTSDGYFIDLMKNHLGTEHSFTRLTAEELSQTLQEATIARDLPGMADVDFSLLAFSKRIRSRVKMALSGECADELFGGYPWYRDPAVREAAGFPWAQNTAVRAAFLSPQLAQRIQPEQYVMAQYQSTIDETHILPDRDPQERRMREMVNLNVNWFMQTLLDRKDRMSMYCGLEVRVPFCDHRIAEYMYRVPWSYKDYQGREKGLLRYAMKDLLPDQILHRKKSPYPKTWDPHYKQLMEDRLQVLLSKPSAAIFEIVNRSALQDLLTTEHSWPWYGQLMQIPQTMAYFLQMDFWLEHYGVDVTLGG